jgi:hypothetical protein
MNRVTQPLKLNEFIDLVKAYGAAPHRWPHDKRLAMEKLIEQSDEAQKQLAIEARLDNALDAMENGLDLRDTANLPLTSDRLHETLLAQFDAFENRTQIYQNSDVQVETILSRRASLATITSLAACLVFGVMLGPFVLDALFPIGSSNIIFETTSLDLIISQP